VWTGKGERLERTFCRKLSKMPAPDLRFRRVPRRVSKRSTDTTLTCLAAATSSPRSTTPRQSVGHLPPWNRLAEGLVPRGQPQSAVRRQTVPHARLRSCLRCSSGRAAVLDDSAWLGEPASGRRVELARSAARVIGHALNNVYRTFPRAATVHLPSTRPRRPNQISSCRLTVAQTWLGTTQTFSPTGGGASRDSPFVPPLPTGEGVGG
jgi:hypothetical protein